MTDGRILWAAFWGLLVVLAALSLAAAYWSLPAFLMVWAGAVLGALALLAFVMAVLGELDTGMTMGRR